MNHILRAQAWALARLKPFAGKTVQFCVPPFNVAFQIQESGELAQSPDGMQADATLSLTSGVLMRILAGDAVAMNLVEITGNTAIAAEIGYIAKNIRWDVEEDLSRVLGDVFAHRLVQTGEKFLEWNKQSVSGLAKTLIEYWTEEQPLLAKPLPVQRFIREVDLLRDDCERLEKRIARMEAL